MNVLDMNQTVVISLLHSVKVRALIQCRSLPNPYNGKQQQVREIIHGQTSKPKRVFSESMTMTASLRYSLKMRSIEHENISSLSTVSVVIVCVINCV